MGTKKSGATEGRKRDKKVTKSMQDLPADRRGKGVKGGNRPTDDGPEESITFVYGKLGTK